MIQSHKKIRCSRELALSTAPEYHKKRRTLFYSSFVCVFNFFFQNLLFSIVREQVLWYVFHYLIFQIVACLFVWLNKSFNVFFLYLFFSRSSFQTNLSSPKQWMITCRTRLICKHDKIAWCMCALSCDVRSKIVIHLCVPNAFMITTKQAIGSNVHSLFN